MTILCPICVVLLDRGFTAVVCLETATPRYQPFGPGRPLRSKGGRTPHTRPQSPREGGSESRAHSTSPDGRVQTGSRRGPGAPCPGRRRGARGRSASGNKGRHGFQTRKKPPVSSSRHAAEGRCAGHGPGHPRALGTSRAPCRPRRQTRVGSRAPVRLRQEPQKRAASAGGARHGLEREGVVRGGGGLGRRQGLHCAGPGR